MLLLALFGVFGMTLAQNSPQLLAVKQFDNNYIGQGGDLLVKYQIFNVGSTLVIFFFYVLHFFFVLSPWYTLHFYVALFYFLCIFLNIFSFLFPAILYIKFPLQGSF